MARALKVRKLLVLAALCVSLTSLALAASPASADRVYDSQISGFTSPWGVSVDSTDRLWVSDTTATPPISLFNGYPSQTLLGTQSGGGHFGPTYLRSLALNSANGNLYVADSGPVVVDIFENGTGSFLEQWNGFGGGYDYLAIDNTAGATKGRVYVAYTPNGVQAFQADHTPVAFTPSVPLGEVRNIAVGPDGNVYVVDAGNQVVDEFAPAGNLVRKFDGTGAPGGFGNINGVAVDPTSNSVLVVDAGKGVIDEFDEVGGYLGQLTGIGPSQSTPFGTLNGGIVVNSGGYVYVADTSSHIVDIFTPGTVLPKITYKPASNEGHTSVTLNANVDPNEGGDVVECKFEYGTDTSYGLGSVPCTPNPASSPPGSHFAVPTDVSADLSGLTAETTYHYRVVAANAEPHGQAKGPDRTYKPGAVLGVTTGAATDVATDSMTLNGSYIGDGNDTHYYFEFGGDTSYGHTTPVVDNGSGSGLQNVSAKAVNLQSHFVYHFRLVAVNSFGTTYGQDEVAEKTPEAPSITGVSSSDLTATSADLHAQINPQGFDTTYHFEYGTTPEYGSSAPAPDGDIGSASTDQGVVVHLANLQPHFTYHFRLVATSKWGTTVSEDQTFNFYPPNCPNENVRQQTQSNYLPDCRAYELVSASDGGGTQLYPGGPNTGLATSPARFSFVGLWSTIPEAGGEPIDSSGDLYVATRSETGWTTRYVGLPSSKAAVSGGPPQGLPGAASWVEPETFYAARAGLANGDTNPSKIQNGVLTDSSMDAFVVWNDGNQSAGSGKNPTPIASNAPYVVSARGKLLDRWPTNLASVPDGAYPPGSNHYPRASSVGPLETAPGGLNALDCPDTLNNPYGMAYSDCPGDVTASEDLNHFVFATRWNRFAPEGQLGAPGSVYDNNTRTNSVAVVSKLANGDPIPAEPTNPVGDPLQIPGVSRDGSHILMAAGAIGPCGHATCGTPYCNFPGAASRCPMQPSHLYMRVDQAVTYDVSDGSPVTFVGMTPAGSKVYFTSPAQLVPEDTDESTDLYMWREEDAAQGGSGLTLVSIGTQGEGNRDNCTAGFVEKCGVVPYSGNSYCQLDGGRGGNCRSDNWIASENGDIYFFSPEQLGGAHGAPNLQNLYVFHEGQVKYVATLTTGQRCLQLTAPDGTTSTEACSLTPIVRMQVTPDDRYMAFVTDSPVTGYDNDGRLEMYRFETATWKIVCVSCIRSGQTPKVDVEASQDGLFMSDDGRTFFSTEDALVDGDTNRALDVYEYVDGRPQLITPGTGETQSPANTILNPAGLLGVSANGIDVYFSTFSTLVPQDHNGLFLKFYDARSGGGFSAPAPPPPCEAADECHAAASSPPPALSSGTSGALTGGNAVKPAKKKRRHGKKGRRHRKAHRHNHQAQGGSR